MADALQLAHGDTDGSEPLNMGRPNPSALLAPKADVNRAFTSPRVKGCLWDRPEKQHKENVSRCGDTQARVEWMAVGGAVTAVGSVHGSSAVHCRQTLSHLYQP